VSWSQESRHDVRREAHGMRIERPELRAAHHPPRPLPTFPVATLPPCCLFRHSLTEMVDAAHITLNAYGVKVRGCRLCMVAYLIN
jgi:hypothetical protein